jgi:hypothetical protein
MPVSLLDRQRIASVYRMPAACHNQPAITIRQWPVCEDGIGMLGIAGGFLATL